MRNIFVYKNENEKNNSILLYFILTGLSLVWKINILLWVCKTGKVYIVHARHTFSFVVYIFLKFFI